MRVLVESGLLSESEASLMGGHEEQLLFSSIVRWTEMSPTTQTSMWIPISMLKEDETFDFKVVSGDWKNIVISSKTLLQM